MLDSSQHTRVHVYAHRGFAARAPENTLPAFALAVQAGADGIEFDVQMTADGELVVIHDDTVDRTTDGFGSVGNLTSHELRHLDAGSWFSPQFTGVNIPTLDEVLGLAAQAPYPVMLNLELKYGDTPYPSLEFRAWERVLAYGLGARTIVSSFYHESLRRLKRAHPEAQIALLYQDGLVDPWLYARYLNAGALHPHYKVVSAEQIAQIRQQGVQVRVYTVNDEDDLRRFCRWGVDAVITEHPDLALRIAHATTPSPLIRVNR